MVDRWVCERCGLTMLASDAETLRWGVDSHRCLPSLGDLMLDEGKSKFERDVICWLVGLYGRPFCLVRASEPMIMIVIE
jgi:hypothetical protein